MAVILADVMNPAALAIDIPNFQLWLLGAVSVLVGATLWLVDRTTGTSTSSPSTDFEGQLLKAYAKELERMRKR